MLIAISVDKVEAVGRWDLGKPSPRGRARLFVFGYLIVFIPVISTSVTFTMR